MLLAQLSLLFLDAVDPLSMPSPTQTIAREINWPMEYLRMVVILVAICAFAYLLLRWFVPRMSLMSGGQNTLFQVVQRFSLEPRKTLYIVRIADQYHLIGTSEQSMNYLTALRDDELKDYVITEKAPSPAAMHKNFVSLLQGLSPGSAARKTGADFKKEE